MCECNKLDKGLLPRTLRFRVGLYAYGLLKLLKVERVTRKVQEVEMPLSNAYLQAWFLKFETKAAVQTYILRT